MNYYEAREREADGRWDFTRMNDGKVWAVGYCADVDHASHGSREEANECYRTFLLDKCLHLDGTTGNVHRPCSVEGCGVLTNIVARIQGPMLDEWPLCDAHRKREVVETLFKGPEKIISSY